MIYSTVRPIAALALKIFFRKIYFTHRERLPIGKPMIIAINHPTAFIEPCVCACFLPTKLYFLVRGDLFKKDLFKKMLNVLHMVPIYRMQEGYHQLKKNEATFDFCYQALDEKKPIVILPEGRTIQEKRLRPIQKGLARIAFGTYEKYGDTDLHIIPIGVNFTQADQFRSVAMFEVGEPIRLKDYYDAYQENPQKTIRQVTTKVKEGLENHIVSIDKKEDEYLVESLFIIYRNGQKEKIIPTLSEDPQPLNAERRIANMVNQMPESEKENWSNKIKQYFYNLEKNKIDDLGLQQPELSASKNLFALAVGFIPFLIGYGINYPAFKYAQYFSLTNVKRLEFKAPVALAVALVLNIVIALLILTVGVFFWGWWAVLFLLGAFYLGKFALAYLEFWQKYKKAKTVQKVDASILEKLKIERKKFEKLIM